MALGGWLAFHDQLVVFDDGITKQVAAHFVELRLGLRTIELELDEFTDAGGFHRRKTVMMDRVAHRHTLRVEHTLFGQHDDFGFHRAHTLGDGARECQRVFSQAPNENCRVTSAARSVYRAA